MQPHKGASSRMLLELDAPAPDFEAKTTQGTITLSRWQPGKWIILFSHHADFTPVCTTEFLAFAAMEQAFAERDVALLGNAIDSVHSHLAWVRNIKDSFNVDIRFPVIADLHMRVAKLYGMVSVQGARAEAARAVFVLDPDRVLRAAMHYPIHVGRNFDEILRLVDALQTVDAHHVACPADWRPGQPALLHAPTTMQDAKQRAATRRDGAWYLTEAAL